MRARLVLLVVASIVPLVGMSLVREYLDYRADRQEIYDELLGTARGVAAGVERDLQLRISSLETLAMSPELTVADPNRFDQQAATFLARQPAGTLLGLATPDLRLRRLYGPDGKPVDELPRGDLSGMAPRGDLSGMAPRGDLSGVAPRGELGDVAPRGELSGVAPRGELGRMDAQVFAAHRSVVTDLSAGRLTGLMGFTIGVPVERDGRVIYELFIRLDPVILADLLARQYVAPETVLTVIDSSGHVVARRPNGTRFLGSAVVPLVWSAVQSRRQGVTHAPTLEGLPAIAAYTHVDPFEWAVIVGAPEEVIFAPMRAAIVHVGGVGAVVLVLGLGLAVLAARGITQPIEQLRNLATRGDQIDPISARTGLPEADMVARALAVAAAERREAAKALAESEARFRALFEKSASGKILIDPETAEVIDCNDAAAAIVGCTVVEVRGRKLTEFAPQTGPDRIRELGRLAADGQTLRYETRVHGRDGARDVLNAVAAVQVGGRSLMLINQIDITDLRRAEAGLLINKERLELARQGASLGIWDWDVVNDALSWSEHQWYLHGVEPRLEGPRPELWRQVVHPADLDRVQREMVAALKSPDQPFATEYSVVLPDGSIRRLLGRGQTIRDGDGRTVRMVGINMDVTVRYEAERARDELICMLETERSRLSEIVEALPVGVGIVDAAGRVLLGNAMMKRINGPILHSMTADRPRGEWIGHDASGKRVPPADFPVRRALATGKTTLPGDEFMFRDRDGGETWFRIGSIPLRWEEGRVQEALGIFLDIDAEKRLLDIQQQINVRLEQRVLEEISAREAAQQRAAHAERMHALGQIAGGIAHDFNNVLQAVSGGAALIERRPEDTARVLRNARMVLDAARRGAAITSRLLAFSRRGDLRAEEVDAALLLHDMAEVLTHTLGGSVVCSVAVQSGLPPLYADRGQLETVLVNLATNARDAMPSGGTLTLNAGSERVSAGLPHPAGLPPGLFIRIEVSDTGSGMDHGVLARVTEPFFTTKEPGKGTGLGLAMAKGFVEQSGGSLSIDSVVGCGTRVILWLPAATGLTKVATGRPLNHPVSTGKPCVLLVDDDAIVRDVLALSLEDAGYAVKAVDGGVAALAWLGEGKRLDIIVTDLTMPAMDGLTVIRMVQERRLNLPAILLTGYAGDGATLAIGGAVNGAFSLLRKPVTGTQLVDRINALLASRKQSSNA